MSCCFLSLMLSILFLLLVRTHSQWITFWCSALRGMESDKYWEVSYCLERVVPNTGGEKAINWSGVGVYWAHPAL